MSMQINLICKQALRHVHTHLFLYASGSSSSAGNTYRSCQIFFTSESHPCFLSFVTHLGYSHRTLKNSSAHLERRTDTVQCNLWKAINISILKPKSNLLVSILDVGLNIHLKINVIFKAKRYSFLIENYTSL